MDLFTAQSDPTAISEHSSKFTLWNQRKLIALLSSLLVFSAVCDLGGPDIEKTDLAPKCGGCGGLTESQFVQLSYDYYVWPEKMEISTFGKEIQVSCYPSSFETMLQYIHLLFTKHVAWNQQAAAEYLKKLKDLLSNPEEDSPETKFGKLVRKLNYQNHPLSKPSLEPSDLENVDFTFAQKFFEGAFSNPADFIFTFSGNFAGNVLEDLTPLVNLYLGTIPHKTEGIPTAVEVKANFDKAIEATRKEIKFPEGITGDIIFAGTEFVGNVMISFPIPVAADEFSHSRNSLLCKVVHARLRKVLRDTLASVLDVVIFPQYLFSPFLPGTDWSLLCL